MTRISDPVGRRAFVTAMGAGAATLGLAAAASAGAATEGVPARWQPAREPQDEWLELPGRHRFVFDCTTAAGVGGALDYGDAYFTASKDGYNLAPGDLAVVIILRHFATAFAFNDAVWAKYGAQFGKMMKFDDPKTQQAPLRNVYDNADGKDSVTLSGMAKNGVHFAVCGLATSKIAEKLAGSDKSRATAIRAELVAGLIAHSHVVPAGIVALNRTQERGYAIAHMG